MYTALQIKMATEALAVHDAECCSEQARCILGRGLTAVLAEGMGKADVRADDVEPIRRGGGAGTGRRQPVRSASEKQIAFIRKLTAELDELEGDTLTTETAEEMIQDGLTPKAASELIDRMLARLSKLRKDSYRAAALERTAGLEPGMYERDGKVYRVKVSGSGNLYASLLVKAENGETYFEYAPGAIRTLTAEHRMTLEQAKAHGKRVGACCVCARTLTDPESVEAGIGPWCASKM